MLEIKHLFFSFTGRPILRDISASYGAARIHGLVGPNGSGKTTLLKNICRIYRPQGGQVKLLDHDCKTMARCHLSTLVSLVPQNPKVNFPISVYDLVLMGRYPHLKRFQALSNHDLEVVERALQATNTAHLRERSLTELSGGEAQLVLIARALATEASLILLDEPTASLDIGNSLAIMELLLELKNQGKTILASVHDLNQARRFCDTITILEDGEIYFYGPSEKAFTATALEEVFRVSLAKTDDFLEFHSLPV
ncbi:MAG: ABC transporter ATP-binding protein [Deltaproteobacteria bacterium]|nr:ABC transporter ATP-binding protein [Deltaproteobacteria bacterium]